MARMRTDTAKSIPEGFLKLVYKHRKVSDKQLKLFDINEGGLQTKILSSGKKSFLLP
jgi:hypothetical protein